MFQRFDVFNMKYNPLGQSSLRFIFLKTNNDIEGSFFAELLKVEIK
jgi:AMP deaminase